LGIFGEFGAKRGWELKRGGVEPGKPGEGGNSKKLCGPTFPPGYKRRECGPGGVNTARSYGGEGITPPRKNTPASKGGREPE